jgi:hypothetical protein
MRNTTGLLLPNLPVDTVPHKTCTTPFSNPKNAPSVYLPLINQLIHSKLVKRNFTLQVCQSTAPQTTTLKLKNVPNLE